MEQPPGFVYLGKEDWVWQLLKSIYRMKQASRMWNKTFNSAILGWNFVRLSCEWCVYMRRSTTGTVTALLLDLGQHASKNELRDLGWFNGEEGMGRHTGLTEG